MSAIMGKNGGIYMKKARSALCALCLALLVPLLIRAWRVLPVDSHPLVAEKYAGWSGVLRLWVFEGWESGAGSLSAWLNGCASRFEKRHPGVYVQPQAVDAGAIASFCDSGILPPDMLLFPPGVLDSPEGLAPLAVPDALRPALRHCGEWGASSYAVPVAMGGYLWAWNATLLDGVPGSWREAGVSPAVMEDDPFHHYGAALLALCSGTYSEASPDAPAEEALPGVDLGLSGGDTPAPAATPAPDESALPCQLPDGFAFDPDAWKNFVNGEAAATPVTQRQVRRLQALSERGAGPDWRLTSGGGGAFTDQLLCLAVVQKPDADAQRALCEAFIQWLLSDDCQGALGEAGAFAVTDADAGFSPGDPLARMDAALRSDGLAAPNCFDAKWPETVAEIVREFVAGEGDPPALWRALAARLVQNPNINSRQAAICPEIASPNGPI